MQELSSASTENAGAAALARRHRRVALACGGFVALMTAAAFASAPLYDLFCKTTGFGGATRSASVAPEAALERTVEVDFDANVAPGLPWSFAPDERSVRVKLGETRLVYYRVTNRAAVETTGTATFNVAPGQAGVHFVKMQCFCFSDQTLQPGESLDMPVAFFVDPALAEDTDLANLKTITLSYTFFAKPVATKPVARGGTPQQQAPL
ncbi:MAG TPA: cytochrome c oxidase assembly protein [Xanthobacteraceae bacterium]|nr:cytochrome c oxidase assembly protein [Xanthobacteraceae bacterium]